MKCEAPLVANLSCVGLRLRCNVSEYFSQLRAVGVCVCVCTCFSVRFRHSDQCSHLVVTEELMEISPAVELSR